MRFRAALTLAACIVRVASVFEDDAFHIDFHYALLGLPERHATFFQRPYSGSRGSLLYTISQNQTVGAVNPKDGALVWRHHVPSQFCHGGYLRSGLDQDIVISAVGNHVMAWSAFDGRLVWEKSLQGVIVRDLEIVEQEDSLANNQIKDALVLLTGDSHGMKRLDGKTGRERWTFDDTSGDVPFQISISPTTIYYISIHTAKLGGLQLKVTFLSPDTGKKTGQYTLDSDLDTISHEHVLFAGANTAAPVLAWMDKTNKALKVNVIGAKSIFSFDAPSDQAVERIVLHAPSHVLSPSHFMVEYQTIIGQSADIFHVDPEKMNVSKAYSLPERRSRGTFTTSTSGADVYFTRITEDDVSVISSSSPNSLGRWSLKGSLELVGAHPEHGVSEVVVKSGVVTAVRSAILYSNGQWALIRNDELAWTRPEFLSLTTSAAWAHLPKQEALAKALAEEGHRNTVSAFLHRVQRHMADLKYFPALVQGIPSRLLGSVTGQAKETTMGDIQQDTFGFRRLVILATQKARLVALDVGSRGKILWNLDLRQFAPNAVFHHPVVKAYDGYVEVKDDGLTQSIFINSSTGGQVFHDNVEENALFSAQGPTILSYTLVDGVLKGFLQNQVHSEPVWSFAPADGERIISHSARAVNEPVASIGRVLGDRSVLYKYLNPNLVLVTAVLESARTVSIYLLDSASGQLLYTVSHSNADTSRPISSTISENWFTYSFTVDAGSKTSSRGYQLVISDLYESPLPDDRGPLGASSNSSTIHPSDTNGIISPYVLSQSYQVPAEISHMAVTQTRQGITSRDLLITVPSLDAIIGIPRTFIDPRRPVGRDPNSQEQAEGLIKYAPLIGFDPKWHLTHRYEVLGIKGIITSESGIESTSLVFAYGLDVFGTRVAPSFAFDILGKGFNKISMLLTVTALFISTLFVAPLVSRKQINTLWTVQ